METAQSALEKAQSLDPQDWETLVLLGKLHETTGRHEEAEKHFQQGAMASQYLPYGLAAYGAYLSRKVQHSASGASAGQGQEEEEELKEDLQLASMCLHSAIRISPTEVAAARSLVLRHADAGCVGGCARLRQGEAGVSAGLSCAGAGEAGGGGLVEAGEGGEGGHERWRVDGFVSGVGAAGSHERGGRTVISEPARRRK
eukprot:292254-Rhodomonas_salina.1